MHQKFTGSVFNLLQITGLFLLVANTTTVYGQAPANDSCSNAISITPNPDGYHQLYPVSDSTVNATTSGTVPSCNAGTGGRKDVWYKFIAGNTTHRLIRQHTAIGAGIATPGIAVYHTDDCSAIGSATEIYCSAIGNTIDLTGLIVGDIYYIQLYANGTGNPDFRYKLWIGTPPGIPSNNECATAVDISDGGVYIGETDAATQSLPPVDCGWGASLTGKDVWYSFTAVQNGDLMLSVTSDPYEAHVVEVYNSCSSSASPIACKDEPPLDITISGMIIGQTVLARVYGFDYDGPFTIQSSGTALPVSQGPLSGKVLQNGTIFLQWETYKEENSLGFEIERSINGIDYYKTGFITSLSNGNSNMRSQYTWQDFSAPSGNLFYRLRQIDKDGRETFSTVLNLYKAGKENVRDLLAYIDKEGQLDVSVTNVEDALAQLSVFDTNGKTVKSLKMQGGALKLDIGDLCPGIYLVHYRNADYTAFTKIVLR